MSFNIFPINKLVISSSAAGLELHTTVLSRFMIPFVTVYVFSLKCCNSMPNWLMSKNTDGVKIHLISSKERKNYIYRNVMRISIKNFRWKGVIMIGIFGSIQRSKSSFLSSNKNILYFKRKYTNKVFKSKLVKLLESMIE